MSPNELDLLRRASTGDHLALERLLVPYQSRLLARIDRRIPAAMRGVVSGEDVLQEAYVDIFRCIRGFNPQDAKRFHRWLITIVDNRLIDFVRAQQAAKRGGGRVAVGLDQGTSSVAPLVAQLHATSHTPSRDAARADAEAAVHLALAGLKPEYREVLRARFLEGLPVSEIAVRMNRTENAVHKLCRRGLETLRGTLGASARFFSES